MNSNSLVNVILVCVFVVLFLGNAAIGLFVDYLWFQEVGYTGVFLTQLRTQWTVGVVVAAVVFLLLWLNVKIARRPSRALVLVSGTDGLEMPRIRELDPQVARVLPLAVAAAGVLVGVAASTRWEDVLLFFQSAPFGRVDPLFGNDLSLYIFQLPLVKLFYGLALLVLALGLASAAALHVVEGRIVVTEQAAAVAPQARAHLLTLAGLLVLGRAAGYQLDRYELLYSTNGIVHGAGYTDVNVLLPMLGLQMLLAAASGVLIIAAGSGRTWKPAAVAMAAWLLCATVGTQGVPSVVQKLRVAPNQFTAEKPYIEHGIRSTRAAYGIEKVEEKDFRAEDNLSVEALRRNDLTVQNIRLWDSGPLLTSYEQLQEIRTYYDFSSVSVDRYLIDGKYRQVMLAAREISSERLPSQLWINERLTYTHGHGVVVSPVNRIVGDGLPDFLVKDIPPTGHSDLKVGRPEIYFGEKSNDYVFVNTAAREFDYPAGENNVYSTYAGSGGVPLMGLARRLAFSLHFKSASILLSSDLTGDSRVMFRRRVRERLTTVAPFLTFDRSPYLVISKGKLYWICDAYTVTDRFPYSQPVTGIGNYLRNSVKAVVDAYNGTVKLYLTDESDPLVRTYDRIFPGLLQPLAAMDPDLRSHIRVPRTLFDVQAQIFALYHMTDPQVFFNREDVWEIPAGDSKVEVDDDPMSLPAELAGSSGPRRMAAPRRTHRAMEPYYTIMKLPDSPKEEFIQLIPFTPSRKDNLRAWMCVRNDPPHYGKLLVYSFPKAKTVYGPSQINARIEQEAEISKQLTLWKQGGSHVIRGNLLIIPIDQSLLYVQSLYLKAAQGEIPELKRVIAAFGHRIVMETSLERSLRALFGEAMADGAASPVKTAPPPKTAEQPPAAAAGPGADASGQRQLAQKALDHLRQARQSYRRDDWARFGKELSELEEALTRLARPPDAAAR